MRIRDDIRLDVPLRESSLAGFSLGAVSISTSVLGAVPITISGTYQQTEIQAIADAVRELNKPLV